MLVREISWDEVIRAGSVIFGATFAAAAHVGGWRDELKTAYRRRVLETHPDRAAVLGRAEAELVAEFRAVSEAYELLAQLRAGPLPQAPPVRPPPAARPTPPPAAKARPAASAPPPAGARARTAAPPPHGAQPHGAPHHAAPHHAAPPRTRAAAAPPPSAEASSAAPPSARAHGAGSHGPAGAPPHRAPPPRRGPAAPGGPARRGGPRGSGATPPPPPPGPAAAERPGEPGPAGAPPPRERGATPPGEPAVLWTAGRLPRRRLRLAEFLYYSGRVSWQDFVASIAWQRTLRPAVGRIAVGFGFLDGWEVSEILERRRAEGAAREPFGEFAVRHGYLTPFQLLALLGQQLRQQRPIGRYFVERGLIMDAEIDLARCFLFQHNARFPM